MPWVSLKSVKVGPSKDFQSKAESHTILEFKIATWCKRVEGLLNDRLGIGKAREQCAAVNVVERSREVPSIFRIVYLKRAVDWNVSGLNGRYWYMKVSLCLRQR